MILKNKRHRNKGYTIIELMVVMSLLGILSIMAVPRYKGKIRDAHIVSADNSARLLTISSQKYYEEHGEWPIGESINNAEILDIPASEAFGEIHKLEGMLYEEYVELPEKNYEDFGVVTEGVYKGNVYLLDGIKGSDDTCHFAQGVTNTSKSYTVVFKDGNRVISTQNILSGDYARLPKSPRKKGYKFEGWDSLPDKIEQNEVIEATWTKLSDINPGENNQNAPSNKTIKYLEELESELILSGKIQFSSDNQMGMFIQMDNDTNPQKIKDRFTRLKKHIYVNVDSLKLLAGTLENGYYGRVKSDELFTGKELAYKINLEEGRRQHDNSDWLKFSIDGKTIYKSRKPFLHSIEWEEIDDVRAVYGSKKVKKDGNIYSVRLMRGLSPKIGIKEGFNSSEEVTVNSEWNRLMMPISVKARDNSFNLGEGYTENVEYWGIDFTDEDLHVNERYGSGTYQWVQEYKGKDGSNHEDYRMTRGGLGISHYTHFKEDSESKSVGWSPVLELIE